MATKNETPTCPICETDALRQVRCSNASCPFAFLACSNCDADQAVAAFAADHEKDCAFGPNSVRAVNPPTFVAPRRAA